ncbi:MAG: TAXI family TRAP transporter solute-binding subunit [Clostridia bacterium]
MKKLLLLVLCVVLGLSMVLSGCGAAKNNLILATGGTSGTYYPFGGAMAQIFNTKVENMNVTAQATGASKENLRLVGKGEADLAIVQNDVMDYAFTGTELFNLEGENEKIEGFRTLATLYPEVVQIVVSPDSGINSVADMKGKRISVGDAGSGVEANAKQVLEAYGLTFDDLKVTRLSFKESANAYKDKQLDGFFVTAGVPNTAIQEITALQDVKVLSIDDASAAKLAEKYPFYTQYTISKDIYKGMTEDAKTVAVKATLIVRKDLKDDVVYDLTKSLFENKEELGNAHAKGKELDINDAIKGVSVPLHPGAEKYYKEKGVVK